jgi:phosphoglycerate dehydrogenase-like enzyme
MTTQKNDVPGKNALRKAAFLAPADTIERVYGAEGRQRIAAMTNLLPEPVSGSSLDERLETLAEVEALFSTWGMPRLRSDQLDRMPRLRAVFYAAGSCQGFGRPLLERGIQISSAWWANAVPVAEFTLAQILLACKGYWRNVAAYRTAPDHHGLVHGPGCYGETVALLGLGAVGQKVVELLRPFRLNVIVYDPFLDPARAQSLGVELVSLVEAFARGMVVSNHLADNPQTTGLVDAALLDQLRPGATLINTGRGRTINQSDLIELLTRRPDVTALLDVTDPEPMPLDSPLRRLPNASISGHIAGSLGDEVRRMGEIAIEEFTRYAHGEPLQHEVTQAMLETMA